MGYSIAIDGLISLSCSSPGFWNSKRRRPRNVHNLHGRENGLARVRPLRLPHGPGQPGAQAVQGGGGRKDWDQGPGEGPVAVRRGRSQNRRHPATRGPGEAVTGTTSPRPRSSCSSAASTSPSSCPTPASRGTPGTRTLPRSTGLSKKPAFVGMSRGGVNEYDWATANPDKVSCIYADNPAIRPESFAKLGELARNDVPLLNICGSLDFLLEKHTLADREPLSPAGRPDHRDDQGRRRPSSAQPAQSPSRSPTGSSSRCRTTGDDRPAFAGRDVHEVVLLQPRELVHCRSGRNGPTPPAAAPGSPSATTATTPGPAARGASPACR